jgi:hypothetical protein
MRRMFAIMAGTVLTVALAGSALAGQNGQGGPTLSASGWRLSGDGVPTYQLQTSAQLGAGHATGTFRFGNESLDIRGGVTCGSVAGHIAVIGGRVSTTTDPDYVGGYFLMWFIDNGPLSFGSWGPDEVSTLDVGGGTSAVEFGAYPDLPADFPTHCPPAAGAGYEQVVSAGLRTVLGDVVVSWSGNQNSQ